jgi:hypothetical protein
MSTADQQGDMVVGSITFSPATVTDQRMVPPRCVSTEVVLLLELFESDGQSAHLYWAGQGNYIQRNYAGVLCTFNPHAARRIPLIHRDIAETLVLALNDGSTRNIDTAFRTWRVVEHGFES